MIEFARSEIGFVRICDDLIGAFVLQRTREWFVDFLIFRYNENNNQMSIELKSTKNTPWKCIQLTFPVFTSSFDPYSMWMRISKANAFVILHLEMVSMLFYATKKDTRKHHLTNEWTNSVMPNLYSRQCVIPCFSLAKYIQSGIFWKPIISLNANWRMSAERRAPMHTTLTHVKCA